jgi:LysM repeat protein
MITDFYSIFVTYIIGMLYRLSILFQIVLLSGLYSCKAYKPIVSNSGSGQSAEDYINMYKDIAVSEMKRTGIPASITLAQGMIESDFGRSSLARDANNHFGIKCHNGWTGATIRHHDDRRNECFRKYRKPEDSFYDHSDFLKSGSRYSFLFDIKPTDYRAWARGLKRAGYATNPDYADMLIRKIEENNLWNFDRGYKSANLPGQAKVSVNETVSAQDSDKIRMPISQTNGSTAVFARVQRVNENNRIQYIVVKDGDTREKLEAEFQLLKWELAKYNELKSDFIIVPGQILYLQPKREKAEPGKDYYTALQGDTMYLISQKYGIRLKSLYLMNRMEEGIEPEAGKKIWLRSIKPVD